MENTLRLFYSCMFIVSIVTIVYASDAATFDSLVERIVRLEERDRAQQNEINRMEERDQLQQKRIAHLEERDRLQKEEVARLVERVKIQQDENKDIRQQLLVQKRNTLQYPRMRSGHMEAHTSESIRMGRIRRAENEMDVAFFATLTSHQTHVGVHQAILFDNVKTNIGNAYNRHLGSFIAPVTGTQINGRNLILFYIDDKRKLSPSNSSYESTSQTVILTLNQNEDITVMRQNEDAQTHGDPFC